MWSLSSGTSTFSAMTVRGYTIGDEYYGTFTRSLYTLFQVLTGESWSEAIARPLIFGFPSEEGGAAFVAIFFTSFILLMQIVLINVVVAVLLENFVTDDGDKDGDKQGDNPESTTATALEVAGMPLNVDPQRFSNLERQVAALDKKLDLDKMLSIISKQSVDVDALMAA